MLQISVAQLHEDNREKLGLAWLAGRPGGAEVVRRDTTDGAARVGHLNLIHPNAIQVIGSQEAAYLDSFDAGAFDQLLSNLFAARPSAIIIADAMTPDRRLIESADRAGTAVFGSPRTAVHVIEHLRRVLAKALAETTSLHGVFMDVLGVGVLITGDSGVGKSELALELISRGHGLVADDVVEISRIAANILEGRCPALLKDFLEVRGLGVLNIRTIFGETAVRPKMNLKLIVHLQRAQQAGAQEAERLPLHEISEEILGLTIRKVVVPVAAGRNLAVLLEAAVRNCILQLRGIDSMQEFLARQREALDRDLD
ncbi:MAG: HPr kinase/phosphorylase [Betaproteobacteria bacterium RIFCSPLOWO2_12_FULL_63_13]|nr:MAG: HPr kinase/phosphorylase [Betaproteobacteria bacterium RIFCSPLOWO2_02_FULL_63_19]OGA48828.1 MAG: HPr kinase/phosphorylase [Betaproteobacteria bacterium RIFCSPLOWO2_12_FULL_63_13]